MSGRKRKILFIEKEEGKEGEEEEDEKGKKSQKQNKTKFFSFFFLSFLYRRLQVRGRKKGTLNWIVLKRRVETEGE